MGLFVKSSVTLTITPAFGVFWIDPHTQKCLPFGFNNFLGSFCRHAFRAADTVGFPGTTLANRAQKHHRMYTNCIRETNGFQSNSFAEVRRP
jgi:hypothetical protein